MEKNIQDDRLDDYVRKSFEDYEEDPASDMWGRIEEELPAPETVTAPGKPSIRRYIWQMSAAAAILLLISSLVCGRLYYENRIREISAQQQKDQGGITQSPVQAPYPADSALPKTQQKNAPAGATKVPSTAMLQTPQATPYPETDQEQSDTHKTTNPGRAQAAPAKGRTVAPNKQPAFASDINPTPEKNLVAPSNLTHTPEKTFAPVPDLDKHTSSVVVDTALNSAASFSQINDFQLLDDKNIALVSYAFAGFKPPIVPIQPQRSPSGWYVGLQVSPILLVEKKAPTHPAPLRPRLISTQEKASFTADYWLKAGKQLQGRWGFETGIGYREIQKNATHRPRFRFINGRPGGNTGSQARSYDFDYDLDTYGGSSEVTLRMVQVDSNITIPEDEPLQFQIKTSERVQLLRIPALVTARIGQGRLTGMLKAGLIGNIVLRNEIEIVTRVSENTRFRPGEGSNAYTLRPNKNLKSFLGYQVSAGLGYQPLRHFSWVLEPTLAGEFARKNSAGKQLPSLVTIGVNAGMNYYF